MSRRRVLIIITAVVVLTRVGSLATNAHAQVVQEASYSAGVLGAAETGSRSTLLRINTYLLLDRFRQET